MQKDKIIKLSIIFIIFILCGCLYSCKDSEKTVVSLEGRVQDSSNKTDSESKSDITSDNDKVTSDNIVKDNDNKTSDDIEPQNNKEAEKLIYVYICGEVQNPGVYQVDEGARMYQVVDLAGGILETGAQNYLNLAETVTDGQKVVVPTKEEAKQLEETPQIEANKETKQEEASSQYININTADEATLTTLPGIGASKAKSIISYRDSKGGFQSIEELMKIEGIKEGVYNKVKDMITVK